MAGGHTIVVTKRQTSTYNTARTARLPVLLDQHNRWNPGAVPLHFLNGPRGLATAGRANNIRYLAASIINGRGGLHCACK